VVIAKFLNVDKICLWLQCLLFVIVGFELVDHPHYSPDLALSDYSLFPNN